MYIIQLLGDCLKFQVILNSGKYCKYLTPIEISHC